MKIKDLMTSCPYKIDAAASLTEVLQLMDVHDIRHVPVVGDGVLLGVLSDREAKLSQLVCQASKYCPTAGEVCSKDPFVISAETPVSDVARDMAAKRIDCALVADTSGNFIGIFTTTDACRALHMVLEERMK